MKTFRPLALVLPILVLLVLNASADDYLKTLTTTAQFEIMGEMTPETTDTSVVWMSNNAAYMSGSEGTAILRKDKGVIYLVYDETKSYMEIPFDLMGDAMSMAESMLGAEVSDSVAQFFMQMADSITFDDMYEEFGDSAQAQAMLDMVQGMSAMFGDGSEPLITAEVFETNETMNIGPWNCKKYVADITMIMGMTITQEIWTTEDIDIDYKAYQIIASGMLASTPGFAGVLEELVKIKGVPVESHGILNMFGAEIAITTELLEHDRTKAPKGIYELPSGYTKIEQPKGAFGAK